MKIAIKNPAPRGVNLERWGDYHFGKSLEAALIRQGAEVVQHFWPDWDLHEGEDAAIWLRGKRRCSPRQGVANAIWILSHPATVTTSELAAFDITYAASARLATELKELGVQGVELMRQCTDGQLFRPDPKPADDDRKGLLFVASSRGVRRPILEWALEAGLTPTLVGQGWKQVTPGRPVHLDYVPNSRLPAMYSNARYGMNDHWGDMAHYQMINNRIFDCLACGLPVISDGFPELAELTDGSVWIVDGPGSFKDAYWSIKLDYTGAREACDALWARIGAQHTFDARARTILDQLGSCTPENRTTPPPPSCHGTAKTIAGLLERAGGLGDDPTKIRLSLLHAFPTRQTSGALSAMPSLSALSAGSGAGPWNTRLDEGQTGLGERRFDVIFVEDSQAWNRSGASGKLMAELADHLKPGGLISALDPHILQTLHNHGHMTQVSQTPPVFRRAAGNPDTAGLTTSSSQP